LKPAATTDFTTILNALTRPEAFPLALPGEESVFVIQTHASAVLLTADRVYKLKKPKDFGFFDFSTPALRRHFCGQEVLVNQRLAPHVYLGVAPIVGYPGGRFHFGSTFAPGDVPLPRSMLDDGRVVDYAVVMVRLPDEAALEYRVRRGTAARYVAAFHATTHTDEHIARFGALDTIRGNWEENFAQMRPYLGRTLDAATFDRIANYVHRFLAGRGALFASRVRDGRIRDCHGDLRLQHVYILDTVDVPSQRLAILDGIEFNERFRYGDVAGEVAFLTMELDGGLADRISRIPSLSAMWRRRATTGCASCCRSMRATAPACAAKCSPSSWTSQKCPKRSASLRASRHNSCSHRRRTMRVDQPGRHSS
jgi:aminoglycoside phosphotransferase family enzyme